MASGVVGWGTYGEEGFGGVVEVLPACRPFSYAGEDPWRLGGEGAGRACVGGWWRVGD